MGKLSKLAGQITTYFVEFCFLLNNMVNKILFYQYK